MLPSDPASTMYHRHRVGAVAEAFAAHAVTIRLSDDVDVSGGDMICRVRNRPHVGQDIEAMVCWLTPRPSCGREPSWR